MNKENVLVNEDNLKSYEVIVSAVIKGALNIFAESEEEAIITALEMAKKDPTHVFDFHEIDTDKLKNETICQESKYC